MNKNRFLVAITAFMLVGCSYPAQRAHESQSADEAPNIFVFGDGHYLSDSNRAVDGLKAYLKEKNATEFIIKLNYDRKSKSFELYTSSTPNVSSQGGVVYKLVVTEAEVVVEKIGGWEN